MRILVHVFLCVLSVQCATVALAAPPTSTDRSDAEHTSKASQDPSFATNDLTDASMDALWDQFTQASGNFNRLLDQSKNNPANTQTGFRIRVRAIDAANDVRSIVGEMLRRNVLQREDQDRAIDTFLTAQQVKGSLMVDIGQCEEATIILKELANDPATKQRALLLNATEKWLLKAQRCHERQVAEQQLLAQQQAAEQEELRQLHEEIRAAEERKQKEEIARLERALQDAKDREQEADITREQQRTLTLQQHDETATAPPAVEDPVQEPVYKQFGLGVTGGIAKIPAFVPGIRYRLHGDASISPQYGGFLFVRTNNQKFDITVNYDYSTIAFDGAWWLKKNAPANEAHWLTVDMPKHTVTVGLEHNFLLDRKGNLHLHLGGLFGFSILPHNKIYRQTVDPGQCLYDLDPSDKGQHLDRFAPGQNCYEARVDEGNVKVSPILPSIGIRAGLRYVIAKRVQVGLQGGVQDGYFFGQLAVGIILTDSTPKESDTPSTATHTDETP